MELKDFIKQSLIDIAYAVKESQDTLSDVAVINPPANYSENPMGDKVSFYDRHTIGFDIAVSASSEHDKKLGVNVLSSFVGGMVSNTTNQECSRINFSIPVYLSRGEIGDFHKHVERKTNPSLSCDGPTATIIESEQ